MRMPASLLIGTRRHAWGVVLVLAVWAGLIASPARAQGPATYLRSSPKVLAAFREVVAKPSECTVRVKCEGQNVALGTVVAADGWILTKFSELKGTPVCRLRDGRELEACVVSVDERYDLALLKIECTGLTPVQWYDSKVCPVGNWVACVGDGEEPAAIGVLSVAARAVPVGRTPPPTNPSGGYLGVGLDPEAEGARISQVMPGSAAEKAGLKVNDIILAVDGEEVRDVDSLIALLQRHKPGDVVNLTVKRGDQELEMKATLGKRPASANRADFQNSLGSELSKRRTGFPTILQHDAVIKPADCGGPLVDLDGRVVGINIARAGRTESYAIPSETVQSLLGQLMPEKITAPRLLEK
ncbi:MAG TPA: PDZ domain-containing protein [Gemmataceae bacterium]|nr:PDZ domain-containing protein [Gemmataceae bacterium]